MNNENINEKTGRQVVEVNDGNINVHVTAILDSIRLEAVIKPYYIPVIFLPGIMGSGLKLLGGETEKYKKFKENLWEHTLDIDTPNGISNQAKLKAEVKAIIRSGLSDKSTKSWPIYKTSSVASKYLWRGASTRQKFLNPEKTTVDYFPKDAKGPGIFSKDDKDLDLAIAMMRGWGSLSEDYWDFLTPLQQTLDALGAQQQKLFSEENGLSSQENKSVSSKSEEAEKTSKERDIWQILQSAGLEKQAFSSLTPNATQNGKQAFFGKENPKALTEDEVAHARCYNFVVFAAGYNWLNCNAVSANGGERVVENGRDYYNGDDCIINVVDKVLANMQEIDPTCKKVILVTHSMGGLVGRAFQAKHADKVLGVVHGVLPATGAATMYKRMRAGFGNKEASGMLASATSSVLGNTATEVSAVLTHSVGALELAPSDSYGEAIVNTQLQKTLAQPNTSNYKQWLQVSNGIKTELSLPKKDPYLEIYAASEWYGLLPDYKPDTVDGKPLENKRVDPRGEFNYKDGEKGTPLSDRQYFKDNTEMAKKFHMVWVVKSNYHPVTYASCVVDAVGEFQAFGKVVYETKRTQASIAEGTWQLRNDTEKGDILLYQQQTQLNIDLHIQHRSDAGDETVPGISGMAPAPYVKELWQQADGEHVHQDSWSAPSALAFATYAITKIIQQDARAKEE